MFLKFFEVLAIDVPHDAITALPPQCSCPQVGELAEILEGRPM